MYVCMYVCIYVCVCNVSYYVCMYVCVCNVSYYVCMYVYVMFLNFRFTFASASPDNIKIWKFPDGNFLQNLSGHQAIVNTLAVNTDNVLVSGGMCPSKAVHLPNTPHCSPPPLPRRQWQHPLLGLALRLQLPEAANSCAARITGQ